MTVTSSGDAPRPEPQQRLGENRKTGSCPDHANVLHTFYVGKGAERSSGTATRLLHIVALSGFVDLEGAGQKQDKFNHS